MCEKPYLSKDMMIDDAKRRGLAPPRLYALGFAHNNCGGGCVRSGQGQFMLLHQVMPERFSVWERKEQEIRDHLAKDVAILRDRTGGNVRPMTLTELRQRQPDCVDMLDIGGCGCFIEDFTMGDDDE